MNQNRNNTNRTDENDNQNGWLTAGAAIAGVAALAGGIYYLASGSKAPPQTSNQEKQPQTKKQQPSNKKQQRPATGNIAPTPSTGGGFMGLINSLAALATNTPR